MGWSKTTFAAGEALTIEYWPLTDGRTGGHFAQATRADGTVIRGAGGPRGVEARCRRSRPRRRRRREMRRPWFVSRRRNARDRCRRGSANASQRAAYASLGDLPDWSGWWGHGSPLPDEWRRNPPPLKPEIRRGQRRGCGRRDRRRCRSIALLPAAAIHGVERRFHRSRRVLVHAGPRDDHERDGLDSPHLYGRSSAARGSRRHQTGYSVGHWEGPDARRRDRRHQPGARCIPTRSQGAVPIGANARISERIFLKDAEHAAVRHRHGRA